MERGGSSSGGDPTGSSEPTSVVTSLEDSTAEESTEIPSEEPEEPSDPELTQAHINAISGNNLTLSGTCYIGTLEYGTTDYDTTVMYTDGYWQGTYDTIASDWYGNEYEYSETNTFFETEDGHVAQSQAPDIYNQIANTYSTFWAQSIFVNMLDQFAASWFEWDSTYSDENGCNRFVMTEEALASEEVYYAEYNLFMSIAGYTFGTSFGGDLQHFYIYTDSENENIVNIEFYEMDSSYSEYGYTYVTNINLDVLNVGTTQIDETALYSPYSVPSGQETQYSAFESAIAHLEEHNYTANVQCIDTTNPDHIYQESKYEVTENGYAGVDYSYQYTTDEETSTETRSLTSEYYFGTHKVEDGTYDYYEGDSADSLTGIAGAGNNPWYNWPDHQFAVEIFELVEEESTSDSYVFQLREDYMEHHRASPVAREFTTDRIPVNYMKEDYEAGFNLKISISSTGYIESFEFIYNYIHYTYQALTTFKQTFSDWGTTSITDDMGKFSRYTAYEYTDFDNTYVSDADNGYSEISIRDSLVDLFGDTVGNAIPDFMADNKDIASHYSYGRYYPTSSSCLDIYFRYYQTDDSGTNYDWDELVAGYYAVAQALIDAGATLTEDDTDYLYEGTMCEGQVSVSVYIDSFNPYYEVKVEFALPSTTTAA